MTRRVVRTINSRRVYCRRAVDCHGVFTDFRPCVQISTPVLAVDVPVYILSCARYFTELVSRKGNGVSANYSVINFFRIASNTLACEHARYFAYGKNVHVTVTSHGQCRREFRFPGVCDSQARRPLFAAARQDDRARSSLNH